MPHDYPPSRARRDLGWLLAQRVIRAWSEVDPSRFTVTTLDDREHELDLVQVRVFWLGSMNGWRAARTSPPNAEVPA